MACPGWVDEGQPYLHEAFGGVKSFQLDGDGAAAIAGKPAPTQEIASIYQISDAVQIPISTPL